MSRVLPAFLLVVLLLASLPAPAVSQAWQMHRLTSRYLPDSGQTAFVDMDDDGDLDVVTGSHAYYGYIGWYENQLHEGESYWNEHLIAELDGATPHNIIAADFNVDGHPDIVAFRANQRPTLWIHPGTPTNELWDQYSFPVHGKYMSSADLNGDGYEDVMLETSWGERVWLENGTWPPETWAVHGFPMEDGVRWFAFDLDDDGDLDITYPHAGFRYIYFNEQGDGLSWSDPLIIENTGDIPSDSYVQEAGDIDGDGDPDMTSLSGWIENTDGTGTSWLAHDLDYPAYLEYCRDVDGDGDLDLAGGSHMRKVWFDNVNGDGSEWIPHEFYDGYEDGGTVHLSGIGELTDDDQLDFVGHRHELFKLFSSQVTDSLEWTVSTIPTPGGGGGPIADIDGDGDLDIFSFVRVESGYMFFWRENQGDLLHWTHHNITLAQTGVTSLLTASDLDGDGDKDLLRSTYDNITHTHGYEWFENRLSEQLEWEWHFITEEDNNDFIGLIDIHNNGYIDIVQKTSTLNHTIVSCLSPIHDPSGEWGRYELLRMSHGGHYIGDGDLRDVDSDGDEDILIRIQKEGVDDHTPSWFENTSGDFSTLIPRYTLTDPEFSAIPLVCTDFTGDGLNDIVVNYGIPGVEDGTMLYRAVSDDGSEWVRVNLHTSLDVLGAADVDGDGDSDLLLDFDNASWGWWENDGEGHFGGHHYVHWIIPNSPYPIDMNQDGLIDFMSFSTWWENGTSVGVMDGEDRAGESAASPDGFALGLPYPNPFNSMTTVAVRVPEPADLTVTVYDLLGREVKSLWSGDAAQGTHHFLFDAAGLASGTYLVRATVPGEMDDVRKVMLVR